MLPVQIDGVRTRILGARPDIPLGTLTQEQSTAVAAGAFLPAQTPSPARVHAAIALKQRRVAEWMSDPLIQAVGVGASLDSPGEAALIMYVLKGESSPHIPPVVGGLRTRIKRTSRFQAGLLRAPSACKLLPHAPSQRK